MSASQLLSQAAAERSLPEFGEAVFHVSGLPDSPIQRLVAALAVVHFRFASSQSFQLGKLQDLEFSTCFVDLEPNCLVKDLTGLIEGLSFEASEGVPEAVSYTHLTLPTKRIV